MLLTQAWSHHRTHHQTSEEVDLRKWPRVTWSDLFTVDRAYKPHMRWICEGLCGIWMCVSERMLCGNVKLYKRKRYKENMYAYTSTGIHTHENNTVSVLSSLSHLHLAHVSGRKTISTGERQQQLVKCRGYQVLLRDNNDILLCNSPLLGLMVMTNGI